MENPDCIRRHFDLLYSEANLGKEREELRSEMKFRRVSDEFRMIADETQSIFVPYDAQARDAIEQLLAAGVLHLKLRHRLQRYTVGLYEKEVWSAGRRGALYEVRPGSNLWI